MTNITISLLKVADVKDNCYVMENGNLRAVISVEGINFSLMGEEERSTLIGGFKSLIDGLDFPIEIVCLSRLENIGDYLNKLSTILNEEQDPLIKFQLEEYINFLENYMKDNLVMKKIFYLVVPYDTIEEGLGKKEKSTAKDLTWRSKVDQLETRVGYIINSLSNIGIISRRLTTIELIQLLYEIYNPNIKWAQVPKQIIEKLAELL